MPWRPYSRHQVDIVSTYSLYLLYSDASRISPSQLLTIICYRRLTCFDYLIDKRRFLVNAKRKKNLGTTKTVIVESFLSLFVWRQLTESHYFLLMEIGNRVAYLLILTCLKQSGIGYVLGGINTKLFWANFATSIVLYLIISGKFHSGRLKQTF